MKKRLIALALLATLGTNVFASEVKPAVEFDRKYQAQVVQSVFFGKTQVMRAGNEVMGAIGTGAVVGAGAIAGVAAINGATMNGVVNGAAGGMVIGAVAGLITGGIASASNASTIECMDNATNNGEKMECASTTWAHIGPLFVQAGLVAGDWQTPLPLKADNTSQSFGGLFMPTPVQEYAADGSPVFRFLITSGDSVPTVFTIQGKYMGEEYAEKYPESRGYEWALSHVQKYNKPLIVRNFVHAPTFNEKATPFLNDPANFAKS